MLKIFIKRDNEFFKKNLRTVVLFIDKEKKVKLSEKEQIRNKRPPFLKGAGN